MVSSNKRPLVKSALSLFIHCKLLGFSYSTCVFFASFCSLVNLSNGLYKKAHITLISIGKLQISVMCEEHPVADDGIRYINIAIAGENQVVESNADTKLEISVTGGELLGAGSARPRTEESYLKGSCRTYYGRAQAIVSQVDKPCKVTVSGADMETVIITLQ